MVNMKKLSCLRCNSFMEEGFVPDFSEEGTKVASWMPGEPVKSFWTGLKVKRKELLPVRAFRCSRCGRLELFAEEKFDGA